MKELLVVSGKGGTGKTTVSAAFAVLANNKVIADCDVDAADLHLVLTPTSTKCDDFYGLSKAVVDSEKCKGCGFCFEVCRFDAVDFEGGIAAIAKELCEGCGVCSRCCPFDAIRMVPNIAGCVMESETPHGPLIHAQLGVGEENSGRLVAEVRRRARKVAEDTHADYVIVDGPPGIGCPVISSASGVDMALVVTEPTVAGKHDLERILDLLEHFGVRPVVCINKSDLDAASSRDISRHCSARGVAVIGQIPFDEDVPRTLSQGRPLVSTDIGPAGDKQMSEGPAAREIRRIWEQVQSLMVADVVSGV